jgi:hypothetical protein
MYENGKMRPIEIIPGMGEGGIKKNDGGAEFGYYILSFCKCHNEPQYKII